MFSNFGVIGFVLLLGVFRGFILEFTNFSFERFSFLIFFLIGIFIYVVVCAR